MIRFALTIATSIFFVVDVAAQISLDDYRREVLDYSQSLHIGQTNLDAAEAEVRRSAASMFPALGVDANFDVAFGDVGGERRWSWGIRPEIRQTLYGGGGERAGFKQAIAEYEVAVEDYDSRILDVAFAADRAYWNLSRAEIYRRAIGDYLAIVGSLRAVVAERYEEGYISKSDLLQVESRMSDAEYQLSAAEQEYLVALHNFNSLRGADAHTEVRLGQTILDSLAMPMRCSEGELLASNPQYSRALSAIDVAHWEVRRVGASYLPNLSAGLFGLWQPSLPNVKGGGTMLDGGLFVKLSVPIYRFGERRHAVRSARSRYDGVVWQSSEVRDQIILNESNGWTNLQTSSSRVAATRRNLDLARENLDISTYSYREGMATILDVLQAQISWLQIYTNAITAQYDYAVAVAAYRYVTATMP